MADSLSDPSADSLGSQLQGAGLESILQTLHMKKETCLLKVSAAGKKGLLYLEQGRLAGAITGSIEGEEAAFSILAWPNSQVAKDSSGRRLRQTIDRAMISLLVELRKRRDEGGRSAPPKKKAVRKQQDRYAATDKRIQQSIDSGDTEATVGLLVDLITRYAQARDFFKAEELYEKLQEVDPMALTEIINAGETIEEEKSKAVDKDHMQIWAGLYALLAQEESNSLFHSLKKYTFEAGQVILKQGGMNSRLFFVDGGEVDIFYRRDNNNYLIRKAGRGELLGADSFFPITNCTSYARATSSLKVHYLSRENYNRINTRFPSLGSTLLDYCIEAEKKLQALQKNINRREHKRYKVQGKVIIKVLSSSGAPTRTVFKADAADISSGGISAQVTISSAETARRLLGRQVELKLEGAAATASRLPPLRGTIIAVIDHYFNNYAINIKYEELLNSTVLQEIIRS